jgi:hypothetical protein
MHSWKEEMDIKIWFELLEIPESGLSDWRMLDWGVEEEPPHHANRSGHSPRYVPK